VWEAVHLIEGLLANAPDIQPSTVHADTQGQSAPVFALATLFGFDLMLRIRNLKDLIFFRPNEQLIYSHVDAPFGERGRNVIDWKLQGVPRGRPQRPHRGAAALLADPQLRARITAATNKVESYNGFCHWLAFGNNGVLPDNDPDEQEKLIKLNILPANLVIFHNALDILDVVRKLVAEGWLITAEQLGAMSVPSRLLPQLAHRALSVRNGGATACPHHDYQRDLFTYAVMEFPCCGSLANAYSF
jgi:hypothetical protein